MKTTELILVLLAFTTAILHLLHIPYSGYALALSLLALSFFYYALGFAFFNEIEYKAIFRKKNYQKIKTHHILFAIANGWILSIILIGVMFKLENLPYAGYILSVGFIVTTVFILLSIILYIKTKSKIYSKIISRQLTTLIIAAGVYFLP